MKNLLLLLVIILFSINNAAHAQDLILLKSGEEIKAIVNEIALDLIKYKKFENPEGPIYTIEKRNVVMITYKNGSKDVFSEQPTVIVQEQKQEEPHQNSSLVAKKGAVRQNGKYLSKYDVRTLMVNNTDALELYNSGKNLILVGDVSGYLGLGVIIVAAIVENKGNFKENSANMVGLVGGVALLATSMTFTFTGRSKIKKSVNRYNSDLKNAESYKITFGINQNGIALALNF